MQICNRIIYPSLLVLFMGLHFSSNVYADCGAPSCSGSGMPEHSMPSSDIPIPIPDAVTPRPPEFPITERLNLADGILEGRLTRLKQLDRQILTTTMLMIKMSEILSIDVHKSSVPESIDSNIPIFSRNISGTR